MDTERWRRLVSTFSPLPQRAWSQERDLADGEQALRALYDWGEHLAQGHPHRRPPGGTRLAADPDGQPDGCQAEAGIAFRALIDQ